MEKVINYLSSIDPVLAALYAALFTWFLTALGAAFVFFFKKMNRAALDGMLGFTGGVMVAASFWSLLAPGIEMSPGEGFEKVIPSAIGFFLGASFLFGLDKVLPHLHINFKESEKEGIKTPWHKTTLLTLAITLHNIPEGLAVGVLFGGVAAGFDGATIGAKESRFLFFEAEAFVEVDQPDSLADVLLHQLGGIEQVVLVVLLQDAQAAWVVDGAQGDGLRAYLLRDVHEL